MIGTKRLFCKRAAWVCAVAGNLHFASPVFAALAAIRLVIGHGAPAGRMRTFLGFEISHSKFAFRLRSSARVPPTPSLLGRFASGPGCEPMAGPTSRPIVDHSRSIDAGRSQFLASQFAAQDLILYIGPELGAKIPQQAKCDLRRTLLQPDRHGVESLGIPLVRSECGTVSAPETPRCERFAARVLARKNGPADRVPGPARLPAFTRTIVIAGPGAGRYPGRTREYCEFPNTRGSTPRACHDQPRSWIRVRANPATAKVLPVMTIKCALMPNVLLIMSLSICTGVPNRSRMRCGNPRIDASRRPDVRTHAVLIHRQRRK